MGCTRSSSSGFACFACFSPVLIFFFGLGFWFHRASLSFSVGRLQFGALHHSRLVSSLPFHLGFGFGIGCSLLFCFLGFAFCTIAISSSLLGRRLSHIAIAFGLVVLASSALSCASIAIAFGSVFLGCIHLFHSGSLVVLLLLSLSVLAWFWSLSFSVGGVLDFTRLCFGCTRVGITSVCCIDLPLRFRPPTILVLGIWVALFRMGRYLGLTSRSIPAFHFYPASTYRLGLHLIHFTYFSSTFHFAPLP